MASGRAPIGHDGKSIELHHLTQNEVSGLTGKKGALAEVSSVFHSKNTKILHVPTARNPNNSTQTLPKNPSFRKENDGTLSQQGKDFNKFQKDYWKQRANELKQ
ncbi:MAG: HNH/ENDO VII family nuclease [Porticoccaceae bacterium]